MGTIDDGVKRRLEEILRKGMRSPDRERMEQASREIGTMMERFGKNGVPTALANLWLDILDMYEMLKNAIAGKYSVPKRFLGAIAVTLLYVLNPMDIVPDFIPGVGYVDDYFMVMLCIRLIRKDLDKYRSWRDSTWGNID